MTELKKRQKLSATVLKLIRIFHKWRNVYLIFVFLLFYINESVGSLVFQLYFGYFFILLIFWVLILKSWAILMGVLKFSCVFFLCFFDFFHNCTFLSYFLNFLLIYLYIWIHSLSFWPDSWIFLFVTIVFAQII